MSARKCYVCGKRKSKNLDLCFHRLHLQINFCFTTGCFILITFIYCKWKIENKFENCVVSLNRNQTVAHIVSEKYLSFGLDSSLLRNVEKLPIQNTKFVKLVRYLSPAYIRIGGTAADCLYFSNLKTGIKVSPKQGINGSIIDGYDISNFTISDKDFLSLYKFSHSARIQMIFDLNVLLRNTNGSWNSNNAKKIVNFAKRHGMQIDWQLGNEPNSFFHVFGRAISAEQLAKDYCALRILLNNLGYQGSSIFGPEINHIDNKNDNGVVYGQKFLKNAKNCINDFTWHQYYLNGHIAKLQDFLNLTVFNRLSLEINIISKAIKLIGYNISMWLSETSSAYGGGAPNLSNRFVAGFLWLDKLGYSAKMGIQVVIRQSLFGASYAMIDNNLNPNPDWWIAVIFKQFVSKKVLILTMPNHFKNIRLYAHCALMHDFMNKASAVIYGINISKEQTKLYIQGLAQEARIFSYILTSDYLMSRQIFMNGQILKLKKNGSLPQFKPDVIRSDQPIILPPYSIVFLVINEVKFSACSK